jgi:hypothetical protein
MDWAAEIARSGIRMKENLESNLLKVQIKRQRTAEARPCAKIGPAFIWWTGSFQLPAQNSMRFASRIFFCNCLILPVDKQKAWIDGMLQPCSNDSAVIASKLMSLTASFGLQTQMGLEAKNLLPAALAVFVPGHINQKESSMEKISSSPDGWRLPRCCYSTFKPQPSSPRARRSTIKAG